MRNNRISVTSSGLTTGLPLPAPGVFPASFKTTSVSDAAGNLLFAFDGTTIIDRNLAVMPAIKTVNFLAGNSKLAIQQIPGTSRYVLLYATSNNLSDVNGSEIYLDFPGAWKQPAAACFFHLDVSCVYRR